jgi:uncharacterized protein involved in outer membrane biogenesis
MSGSSSNETPSRRGRWLRRVGYVAGALAALVLIAWVAVPPFVRSQAESGLSALLDRRTTVESVSFNPLRLRLTLRKLAVARREGADSLFSFDELVADISPASLWHRAPVLDALKVSRPHFWLLRDADGRYNIQDLVDALLSTPIEVPRASLNNIEIESGTAVFVDRATGREHKLEGLDVAIPFLSSLPYEAAIHVQPRVKGKFNGSSFALTGTSTPFAERREATLDVGIDALPLPAYVAYLPFPPRFDLAGGALTTRLQAVFAGGGDKGNRLELRGDARIDGLALRRRDGTPLIAAERVAVGIEKIDLLGQDVRIAKVVVDVPSLDIRRRADGRFEWEQLLADAVPAAAPKSPSVANATGATASPPPRPPRATGERPWSMRVEKFLVANGTLALVDEGSTFKSTLVDVAIDAAGIGSRPGEKGHVRIDFVSSDRIAAFSGEADVEPAVPSASGRFALTKFSLGLLSPFYQSALAVDVQRGSLDYASAFTVGAEGNLRLADGEATIMDLRLALPRTPQPMWRVPKLIGRGIEVDVARQHVSIADVQSRGAALRVQREADGAFEMTRIVKRSEESAKTPDAGIWTLLINKLALESITLDFEDRVPQPPAKLALRDLAVTATNVGSAPGVASKVTLRSRVAEQGRVAFAGTLVRQPFGMDGRLDLQGFPLVALKPYVEPQANVVITDGALTAKGQLALHVPPAGDVRAAWKGDATIADFASLDKPTASDLARWKLLALDQLDIAGDPFRASVARIGLDDFYARVIVYPDATLNVMRLVTPGAEPEPAAAVTPPAAPAPATAPATATSAPSQPAAARGALPIAIGRIEVARGNVNFSDLYIKPNYSANLTDVSGSVTTLSTEQAGDVILSARLDHSAPVEIQGRLHPFAKELSLDIAGKARNIDLPPLTPYSGKYAGYGIEKGQLSFEIRYQIESRKLTAENRLVLDQLRFGARVESPSATKLPVLLAVALLKDSRGVIDIRLPISGSLDDPKFSLGGIIVQIIVNLITKAVTAPFALLSAVFGGGEELSTIPFVAGSAALGADGQKRLDTLGKALLDRPALKLDIAGRADPAADREALRRASVQEAMRREKMKSLVAEGKAPASVDQVAIAEEERTRWLRAAYREAPIPDRPRNVVGMLKDVPPAEMEAMLLTHAKVDDEALRSLANARARTVNDALVAKGVSDDRLFLVAPKLGGDAASGGSPGASGSAAGSTPARVDLALR